MNVHLGHLPRAYARARGEARSPYILDILDILEGVQGVQEVRLWGASCARYARAREEVEVSTWRQSLAATIRLIGRVIAERPRAGSATGAVR